MKDTAAAEWDKNTWPELERLARECPEAGIHFQKTETYNRLKDASSTTGDWFAGLVVKEPWWKDTVPDVGILTDTDES